MHCSSSSLLVFQVILSQTLECRRDCLGLPVFLLPLSESERAFDAVQLSGYCIEGGRPHSNVVLSVPSHQRPHRMRAYQVQDC